MSDSPARAQVHTVECPHCGQSFEAELLTGPAPRYSGFKCPHCKLFVPLERVDEEPADGLTKQTPTQTGARAKPTRPPSGAAQSAP